MNVHPRTVQRWCRNRQISHIRKGRLIRFTEEHVREFEATYVREPEERIDVDAPNPGYQRTAVVIPMKPPAA